MGRVGRPGRPVAGGVENRGGLYMLKVAVVGAGALGSVFGGFLAGVGHKVDLLGRSWHLDWVAEKGLRIDGIWGDLRVDKCRPVTRPADLASDYDLVLVCVKSYDTASTVRDCRHAVGERTTVVSLQNGLGNIPVLTGLFGPERCAAGRVIFGAEIIKPGRVRVTVCADDVVLGPVSGASAAEAIRRAAGVINRAGIPCRYEEKVLSYIWAKAIYNCALNPLGALLGVDYGTLADSAAARAVMDDVIRECFAIAGARGIEMPWDSAEAYLADFYEKLVPPTRDHRPSMLQDIERGRRTEIEALNGMIVRYGRETGVPTPVNEMISHLIRFREAQAR